MIAAKETTLTEIGVMLTHVVEHMATKEDVARLDTRIDDLRTEMIDQFEHAGKQVQTIYDRLRDISAEIAVIHRRVERLEELGASNAGFAKEIDHLLTRVAEIEKNLGIYDKRKIETEVGIAQFTALCRESVMRYVADWEVLTERMGFWVDLTHAYFTLHNDYIESVWYLLKQLWDRGLIYQGYKVVPYDPRIGATLSSHEVALGYRDVEDPSKLLGPETYTAAGSAASAATFAARCGGISS